MQIQRHECETFVPQPNHGNALYLPDFDACDNVAMRNMKVAVGQFTVTEKPGHNISIISGFASEAARNHARILLLPEGLIARSADDPHYTADHAQTIDGPFVTALRGISEANNLAVMGTVHLHEDTADLPYNCFLVIDHGRILLEYRKIHLYDAFGERESDSIAPGHEIPPLVDIDGWKFGVMTCYDIRFPELARRHAVAGADALVVSAAWARGEGKVDHWTTLCKARALENTCYLMACSEHSGHDIGHSMVVDPAARILAQSGERDELIYADLNRDRLEDVRRILPVLKNRRITL